MTWIITKYLVTAALVVLISELAKRNDQLGAAVAALPVVTVLTLVWLYLEKQPQEKLSNHAAYTFWYVLPTLPMFLIFPWLLPCFGFWLTLLWSALITMACFAALAMAARPFGIKLLP